MIIFNIQEQGFWHSKNLNLNPCDLKKAVIFGTNQWGKLKKKETHLSLLKFL
ncbi:hypothetical protein Hanom_Chr05g00452981 [Helianthus anomalus]